jgi:hypothetical protein
MSRLWPVAEAAQADYETLRGAALVGTPLIGPAATRFEIAGLWALIRRPVADAEFIPQLFGARRPPWTPHGDPRLEALAAAYELVLTAGRDINHEDKETGS